MTLNLKEVEEQLKKTGGGDREIFMRDFAPALLLELRAARAKLADKNYHLCPARKFKTACPYPNVCRDQEGCVDGKIR